MKPTRLTNLELQKPFMLMACYDVAFDTYISLIKKMETSKRKFFNNGRSKIKWQESIRHNEIKDKIKNCSEYLRELDTKIHQYILSHNRPQSYKKAL